MKMDNTQIIAFYRFIHIEDPAHLRQELYEHCERLNISGVLLVASEGINGTLAGLKPDIASFLEWVQQDERFANLSPKVAYSSTSPFYRLRVRLKSEIVPLGVQGVDPNKIVGEYVQPENWNALISDPEVMIIDVRNDYEVQAGTFRGAINPKTDQFRDFPDWVNETMLEHKERRIAMFCTGGIRCEKATAYMKENGFNNVFHLKGGILQYLEDISVQASLWDGECFVFDRRFTVDHHLNPGQTEICFACSYPITQEGKNSPHYSVGVSCENCFSWWTEAQRSSFSERQKQIELAEMREENHLGMQQNRSSSQSHKSNEDLS
jgi:UPF0176 protein